MEFVCQAVPHGNRRIFRQLLHNGLAIAAVLNAVINAGENPCRVSDAFLLSNLRAGGIQISAVHSKIRCRHLKGTAGAGGGLFKNQGNMLALADLMRNPRLFLGLQFRCKIYKTLNFLIGKVQQLQEISAFQFANFHICSPFSACRCGAGAAQIFAAVLSSAPPVSDRQGQ